MKNGLFIALTFLVGCQDFNSNSFDRSKFGPTIITETDPNFLAAYNVIKTRCSNCHYHSDWSERLNNESWLQSGIINRGDANNSVFIRRIKNSGAANNTMPLNQGPLPAAEFDALTLWIDNIP